MCRRFDSCQGYLALTWMPRTGGDATGKEVSTSIWRKRIDMSRQPKRDLRRRQQRRRKVRYLRERLEATHDSGERQRLIAKIKKISPNAPVPDR
jgi:hypothetical protein